jgi:hypothetical protein
VQSILSREPLWPQRLDDIRRLATTLPFRCIVCVLALSLHVLAIEKLSKDRFGYDFGRPFFPPPQFIDAAHDSVPFGWDRLIVSRWDSQHYMELALRGYEPCKTKDELLPGQFPDDDKRCQMNFFPTYGWIGRWVAAKLSWAIDWSLLAVSMVASFGFLMLLTSRVITQALGVGTTYLAFLLVNTFTSGFMLVTVHTEPLFLLLAMGTFYCFARRWLFPAALLAGALSAVRVTGVAGGLAYATGLALLTLYERPRWPVWILRAFYVVVSGWGLLALMAFYQHKFGDALIYMHAHGRQYHHEASLSKILWPDTRLLMQSLWAEPHDGVWLGAGLFWFALGHRKGLERFDVPAQAFWYTFFAGVVGISMLGSSEYGYGGLARYLLCVPPLFFAMAGIMRRRPIVLAIWLYVSIAHYWSGSMCFYVSQNAPDRFAKCGFARSFVE